ncbi:MAG TPA: hypothetical protein VFS65_02620, partial [Candidatus Saccharimonadales bacterium]|nr:hypothetical protein [Candidatus Saccharimonadales bacterium]
MIVLSISDKLIIEECLICYNDDMLDIRFIRENAGTVQENAKNKGYDVSITELLEIDAKRRELSQRADELREKRNIINDQLKNAGKPSAEIIEESKSIKSQIIEIETELKPVEEAYAQLMNQVPNMMQSAVPIGGEESSVEIKKWGDQNSGAIDHLDFAVKRDWVDFERGAKVAGAKFYYLKGDLALLENAITQFALDFVTKKGFTFITVPHMVNSRISQGAGFAPRSSAESNEYFIEGEDLTLIGTAEAPLTGYHADEIINEADLPLLYVGYSPSYRKEAGTYGKHSRG